MADCMDFGNSFEEFVEFFSFKDSKEIYTNGSDLVQSFRVMQGYEHFKKKNYEQGRTDMRDDVIAIIAQHHFDDDKDNMDLMLHNICKEIKSIKQ